MNTGIYGGSFNPPHNGHVKLAREALSLFSLDRLIIMPAFVSPFKAGAAAVSARARYDMCVLAFENENTSVSSLETERGGTSYTVDTVKELSALYPDDRLFLIVGSDMLLSFDRWKNYREILNYVTLAAVSRGGDDEKELSAFAANTSVFPAGSVCVRSFTPLEISSTEVRARCALGGDISALVPESVNRYIENGGYYRVKP